MPPLGSVVVIAEQQGQFLAVELPRRRVVFPGGFMGWQEQPEQTAEREGREETGLLLRPIGLLNVRAIPSKNMTRLSTVTFTYAAEVIGGTLRKNIEGRPCWLSEEELRQRLEPGYLNALEMYLRWRASKS